MGREQPHRRQAEQPLAEHRQDRREAHDRPCHLDAVVRCGFGEKKDLATIGEQRREARAEVQAPTIELRKMGDEEGGRRGLRLARGVGPLAEAV